jgi:hypothetical protein
MESMSAIAATYTSQVKKLKMNIIGAINNPQLFKSCFRELDTWSAWLTLLKAVFGLEMDDKELFLYSECTGGRKKAPVKAIKELWAIVGRRGGKSFICAVVATYLALFYDFKKYLSPGERGTIQIIAADRSQAQVILNYIKGILESSPVFSQYVLNDYRESIELTNGITVEVMSCSYRSVRGRTVVCAVFDEVAFWRVEGVSPDREILAAIRPSMATIPNSLLLVISSPYARSGVLYEHHRDYYGKDDGEILVWQSPTRVMNPTISDKLIDKETTKDPSAARAEWQAQFRDDIEEFLSLDAINAVCVLPGEMAADKHKVYQAFVDPSGGRADAMTLAIGHNDWNGSHQLVDLLRAWEPPFNPEDVVVEMAGILKRYRVSTVTGDRYGAGWVEGAFSKVGIHYEPCVKVKSDLYLDLEGYVNTAKVKLPKDKHLIDELMALERRRGRRGRDRIDHPPRGRDDRANAVAGLINSLVESSGSFFSMCDLG